MRSRTLAGRIAVTHTIATLLALAGVVAATTISVTTLLNRRADRALRDIAERAAPLTGGQEAASFGTPWIEYELDEIRPAWMRVEIHDQAHRILAATGPALELPARDVAESGCRTHDTTRICVITAGMFFVIAAASEAEDLATRDAFLVAMLIVTALAGALVTFSSRSVARRALRPLSRLTERISAINPGSGDRVALTSGIAELDRFAARFDELVSRFDDALARERRLTAHASHELRTPLTVARAEIDALASSVDATQERGRALAALDRLSELVEILLWFARAQVRLDDAALDVVNLADVVRAQVAERAQLDPSFVVRCDLPDEALIRGDERLLCRVAANLVDNAVKHGDGGTIDLRAEREAGMVRLSVTNRGRLATELADRVFEPFFRGPRAAGLPGFGLGLPFARAVAHAHGGDLVIGEGRNDETVLVLHLPLVAWSDTLTGHE
jgi:signal transduction histidine kinase